MKTKNTVKNGRQEWEQKFTVRGASKACLKRIEELVREECFSSKARVIIATAAPSPPCGGPGDPC